MTTLSSSSGPPSVQSDVAGLGSMGLHELRRIWRARFGEPPKLRSVELLRHLLAWRIQAAALGGLDRQTRNALKRNPRSGAQGRLQLGTRLAREYRGVEHLVEVGEEGYRYRGRVYASLSVVAREITGTRWNGWRFFGLVEPKS